MKIAKSTLVLLFILGCRAPDWVEFSSQKGNFSVLLPKKPVEEKETVNTKIGPVELYAFLVELQNGKVVYGVTYSDYPAEMVEKSNPDDLLDRARNGAVRNISGKIIKEKRIVIEGYPGRELRVVFGKTGVMKYRLYLVKNRLYQIMVLAEEENLLSSADERFLNSFRLLGDK